MAEPLVSVVVATHNRPARLERLLESLSAQRLERHQFEVIVVDDASEQQTGQLLARWETEAALPLRTIRLEAPRGPAAARNAGWRSARAALVAFTDDDCAADPGWLSEGLRVHASEPMSIVQGATVPDPADGGALGPRTRTVSVDSLGPQYEACNIFYARALLESLDGFDERFDARAPGEDTDLAWRAIERGTATVFAPDAVVFHAVERVGIRGMLRLADRWGETARVFSAHPEARSMLYLRVFWNVWHYLLWRSLLAIMAPRSLRRLILTRHLLELRKRSIEAGEGAALIPLLLICDAVECWSMARGAVRHRTFVL